MNFSMKTDICAIKYLNLLPEFEIKIYIEIQFLLDSSHKRDLETKESLV